MIRIVDVICKIFESFHDTCLLFHNTIDNQLPCQDVSVGGRWWYGTTTPS